jgi:hypothetical protein
MNELLITRSDLLLTIELLLQVVENADPISAAAAERLIELYRTMVP